MPRTAALTEFKTSLGRARALLALDVKNYSDPPKPNEIQSSLALRGGAVVLSVAALEKYLRDVFEEVMDDLISHPRYSYTNLPEVIQLHSAAESLTWAVRGEPYAPIRRNADKIRDMQISVNRLYNGRIYPKVFAHTQSNPNSETVKSMMKNIGITNYFDSIKIRFERRLGFSIHNTYIKDSLDSIINTRHLIAHTATAGNVTREDLRRSFKFLNILTEIIDSSIRVRLIEIKRSL